MNTTYSFSSLIGPVISHYLALKLSIGRKCEVEYGVLKHLDIFLAASQSDLTAESFAGWSRIHQHITPSSLRNWMGIIRNLCIYRRRTAPSCFVPDRLQFPKPSQPVQPHIFTEDEIIRLLEAINQLKPGSRSILRQENFRLALVLLYTSGLRRGELPRLTIGDYNPIEHTLLIRESKFHKSRLLPLSADGWMEVDAHLKNRRRLHLPISVDSPLLWNTYNKTGFYTGWGIATTFRDLFRTVKIHTTSDHLPRLHDFRHTFAVHALLRWYHEGENVQVKLPFLSIYMGHVSIVSTEYYLRFIDELTSSASSLFEEHCGGIVSILNEGGEL